MSVVLGQKCVRRAETRPAVGWVLIRHHEVSVGETGVGELFSERHREICTPTPVFPATGAVLGSVIGAVAYLSK